jgi:thioredoxin-dependent peroxiredoxin
MSKLKKGDVAPHFKAEDGRGERIDLAQLTSDGRVLLLFVRHLGCPLCREILNDLAHAINDLGDNCGSIVAVTESTTARVAEFSEKSNIPFHIISNRQKDIFEAYGVGQGGIGVMLGPSVLAAAVRATFRGHMPGRIEGSELQLPADFVIDRDGKITLAYYGKNIADHLPVKTLIDALCAG